MKNLLIVIALIFSTQLSFANDSTAYQKAMAKQINQLEINETTAEYQATANAFTRIAQNETQEWLPLYYAAYSYISAGFSNKLSLEEKDVYFDKAISIIEEAALISENNSELTALHGYALMGKLSADAANRGQSLSPRVMQTFGKAIQQNPQNPRALFLMAQMEYGMAQFLGGGTEKACGMAQQSVALYTQQPSEGLAPHWGAKSAKSMAAKCQ